MGMNGMSGGKGSMPMPAPQPSMGGLAGKGSGGMSKGSGAMPNPAFAQNSGGGMNSSLGGGMQQGTNPYAQNTGSGLNSMAMSGGLDARNAAMQAMGGGDQNSMAGGPKMFTQSASQGLIPGLGAPQQQTPGFQFGGGYYGGDALGTAGQILAGGPPSLDPSKAGDPRAIGNFGPGAVTSMPGMPTGGGTGMGGGGLPPGGGGGQPIIQVPPPPVTPGMNMPPYMPGQSPPPGPNVAPAGSGGTPGLPTPPGIQPGNVGPPGFNGGATQTAGAIPKSLTAPAGSTPFSSFANLSPQQFNAVRAQNPMLAESLFSRLPQSQKDTLSQANGWDNLQTNQWINQANYGDLGGTRGWDSPQAQSLLSSLGINVPTNAPAPVSAGTQAMRGAIPGMTYSRDGTAVGMGTRNPRPYG